MKRLALVSAIVMLLIVPAVALAQYDYPSGPTMGGEGPTGGGSSGGGISIGSVPPGGGEMVPDLGDIPMGGGGGDVSIVDFAFQPGAISVGVGDTVTWRNTGAAPHTVTVFNGAFDSGTLNPGGSYSQTFTEPGAYMYHCEIHPNMVGTVRVSAA